MQGLITLARLENTLRLGVPPTKLLWRNQVMPQIHAFHNSRLTYPFHGGECNVQELPFHDSIPDGTEIVIRMSPFTIRDLIV